MCLSKVWHKLISCFAFLKQKPKIVRLAVPAFVLAAGIGAVLSVLYLTLFAWLGSDHGAEIREVADSLLPLFKWHTDLGQFLVQAVLTVAAATICSLAFVLLYNTLLSILGEED